MKNNTCPPLSDIKTAAKNRWANILQSVCGLTEAQTTPGNRGMPCPHCNGHDRYEFKSVEDGYYMCRGCGAGDGFSMVMKMNCCDFREALLQIASSMGMERPALPPAPAPAPAPATTGTERKAQWVYRHATLADPQHPYLIKKRLPPRFFKMYRENLVVPIYDSDHSLVNLQFIRADGSKFFLKNGRVKRCCAWFGNTSGHTVYVCEGIANAVSLHLMKHRTAVAALSVGNMPDVAKILREQLPDSRLILYLDNDRPTQNRPWRPGASALYAHRFFDAVEIPPVGLDASDLFCQTGFHGKQFHG